MSCKLVLSDNVKKQIKKMDKFIALLILKEMQKNFKQYRKSKISRQSFNWE